MTYRTYKPDDIGTRVLSAPMGIVERRSSRALPPTLLNMISVLLGMAMALSSASSAAAARTDRWEIDPDGTFVCKLDGNDPASDRIDVTMQGRRLMLNVKFPSDDGTATLTQGPTTGWPILKESWHHFREEIVRSPGYDLPTIKIDGTGMRQPRRLAYCYNGIFTIQYGSENSIQLRRDIFPAVDKRAAIQVWTITNTGSSSVTVEVPSESSVLSTEDDAHGIPTIVERFVHGITEQPLPAGGSQSCSVIMTCRRTSDAVLKVDVNQERRNRLNLFAKAKGAMRLETPDTLINNTFDMAKLRVLESGIETSKGIVSTTGTLAYFPGIFANDNVEYIGPSYTYLNDANLDETMINTYQVWLDDLDFRAIRGSFESFLVTPYNDGRRGDESMMLYGLSYYLLTLADQDTANHFWPLIEKSVSIIKAKTNAQGVVKSHHDEMEGRLPMGKANLSTSSLAYGGLRKASQLAHAMGKTSQAHEYDKLADALYDAIESHFGAAVEGYDTYRYYDGNTALRGWICLPLNMGITLRKDQTLSALFSSNLWYQNDTDFKVNLKAISTEEHSAWSRETMYALRAAFKTGYANTALDKMKMVARYHMLGPRGPYSDEDHSDLLSPSVLYTAIVTQGILGIEPQSFTRFQCTPNLPDAWSHTNLRNIYLMGHTVDLEAQRESGKIRLTVKTEGQTILNQIKEPGSTFTIEFPASTP